MQTDRYSFPSVGEVALWPSVLRRNQRYGKRETLLCCRPVECRDIGVHVENEKNPHVTVLSEVIERWRRNPVFNLNSRTRIGNQPWLSWNSLAVYIAGTCVADWIEQVPISLFLLPLSFYHLAQFLSETETMNHTPFPLALFQLAPNSAASPPFSSYGPPRQPAL